MRQAFVGTVKVLVKAEACLNSVSGACDWFSGLLSENEDVIDWGYINHEKDPHPALIGDGYKEGDLLLEGAGI